MQYQCEAKTGAVWATSRDPRVTPFGRFLRRTHLDELPQLWNIFHGDMGFIGPRPERPEIVEKLLLDIPNFNERLLIKPGLTGLSQVLQQADTSVDSARQKLRNDLDYRRRESFWIDLRIVVGTALVILGASRQTVGTMLRLSRKSQQVKPTLKSSNDSIFDAPRERPQLCDSGIMGAV
jgi:lipopolysaccharide/colanic/teichoic acid biosynthesis glycosyltransferase